MNTAELSDDLRMQRFGHEKEQSPGKEQHNGPSSWIHSSRESMSLSPAAESRQRYGHDPREVAEAVVEQAHALI